MDNKEERLIQSRMAEPTIKMPDGYYSGDKPNLNLRQFVEDHLIEKPYDPDNDNYDVSAYDKPIKATKATAIYNMHTYWSKKPHDAIRQYIRHYTEPGDLVLDPFCGSGGTALAALMEGRKAIAIDRSPAATFITKNYCTPVDTDELEVAFEKLKAQVEKEIGCLYETRCDRCGGEATTAYTVYSQVFQCPRCLEKVSLFDCVEAEGKTAKGGVKKVSACPYCLKEKGIVEEISTRSERYGAIPVLVSYLCKDDCKPVRDQRKYNDPDHKKNDYFQRYDLGKLKEIEGKDIPYWYPTDRMMNAPEEQTRWGVKWRAGTSNFKTVDELFTKRNLWALSLIYKNILKLNNHKASIIDSLLFAFQGIALINSKMCEAKNTQITKGTYYMPQVYKELNPISSINTKVKTITKANNMRKLKSSSLIISTETATQIQNVANSSVDYIFTDPPYAEKVQYGELNFIWEAWLNLDTKWHDEEIIVNNVRGKTEADWACMMHQAMSECYRVLKPGRWLSLCYHDTSAGTWTLIQDIMAEVGFIVESAGEAIYIDTEQKSFNQILADKVNKRDLVINFRKPKPGEVTEIASITGSEDEDTFIDKIRLIIREYLAKNPGATKDHIYDEVVSRMVRKGQMEAHNFDEILALVAEEARTPIKKNLFEYEDPNIYGSHEIRRWYLKETELAITDATESAKEDEVANTLRIFMIKYLKQFPEQEGVHYSDVFEHYIYAMQDKPRRQLIEILPDYFYKTETGTWRLPSSKEEEEAKAKGRAKGLGRRVKRYIAWLQQGVPISDDERPNDVTLAEWIRHCKKAGLYLEGRLLYEKSGLSIDNLSEEEAASVEEDYQVCIRLLGRRE